jgi:quercetin dioxygenase-like cupin family protein
MIRSEAIELSSNRAGGEGTLTVSKILNPEDMEGKAEAIMKITFPVGTSIGVHQHNDAFEQYHVLSGSGIFHDNGEDKQIKAGETGLMKPGGIHGIKNTGESEMVIIAFFFVT